MKIKRAFLIVLDSFGIGEMTDAAEFGDSGCNTLRSIVQSARYATPNLGRLGLFNIDGVDFGERTENPKASFARLGERSRGKDTTIGHWEIAGIVSKKALPTYPNGFPSDLIEKLEKAFGRKILCNKPYSGTAVIHDYGREHERSGALIVYTSADSVLQIAAHESVVSPKDLYGYCKMARQILTGEHSVGRVIARPFIGSYPDYVRTPRRHDFSMLPPAETILDALAKDGKMTIGVGKIADIFAGRGVKRHIPMESNDDGMNKAIAALDEDFAGLCFVNLVDFDMKFGHRRDIDGYAQAATDFDEKLELFLKKMQSDDILLITADHGCDPGAGGTDHTREFVPLLVYGGAVKAGVNLGTRPTFADIAATLAEIFGVELKTEGRSFWSEIRRG